MPRRYVNSIPSLCCIAIGVPCGRRRNEGNDYISAWGLGVARLRQTGLSYEPQIVKRAKMQGFTLFLCLYGNG